jgi:hypothetical protein
MFTIHQSHTIAWRQATLAKPVCGLQNGSMEIDFSYNPGRSGPFYKESELT